MEITTTLAHFCLFWPCYYPGNYHRQELSISTVDLVLKGSSKIVKKILFNNDFWAAAPKG